MRIVVKSLYWLGIALAAVVVVPAACVVVGALLLFQLYRWVELLVVFDGDEDARAEYRARFANPRV